MSANLDMSNGRANFAFTGDRNDIWHKQGTAMPDGAPFEVWLKASGLDFEVIKVPAMAMRNAGSEHAPQTVENFNFHMRRDTGTILGHGTDTYQITQPRTALEFTNQFVSVDDRFAMDTAGALDGGKRIWALARYNGDMTVAGDRHKGRLMFTTSFDGTSANIAKLLMTRVVCQNTIAVGLGEKTPTIRVRHSTKFDARAAATELAKVAKGFEQWKIIGDAMAQVTMSAAEVSQFFKQVLEIPFDAKKDEIGTRKFNQFADLQKAFAVSRHERNEQSGSDIPVWTALQAVTRYVDHDRSVRASAANGNEDSARFLSANFGSGDSLKMDAWNLLLPRVRDLVPVAA